MIDETNTFGQIILEKSKIMFETIKQWLTLAAPVGAIVFIIYNIKGFIEAFKGPDGKWSLSEVSKVIIIGILLYMVNKDGNRDHDWTYYSDAVYFVFLGGLFAMAELKEIVKLISAMMGKNKKSSDE